MIEKTNLMKKKVDAIYFLANDNKDKKKREWDKKWTKGLIEGTLVCPASNTLVVSINDEPVSFQDFVAFDKTVLHTNGKYYIRYVPTTDRYYDPKFPYVIGQDLLDFKVVTSGPKHFFHLCERIPELAWLRRNSNFKNELFGFAKLHPNICMPFCLDVVKYGDMIIKKAIEKNIDINKAPFVSYQCSEQNYEMYKTKPTAPKRTKEELMDVINEIGEKYGEQEHND